tara:strand:+ start:953 stop:1750 length:798 start_codon:yes stop_codon:yes gene_type:complete
MIFINHQRKIIFIHIPKTGGTYIGEILVKYYNFEDLSWCLKHGRPDHDEICEDIVYRCSLKRRHFNKTMGIIEYCKTSDFLNEKMNMTPQKWKEYYKFAIVRNPVARFISGLREMKRFEIKRNPSWKLPNLELYLTRGKYVNDVEYGHIFMTQKQNLSDEYGNIFVNGLIKTENLENDFRSLMIYLKFKIIHPPSTNVNSSLNKEPIYLSPNNIKQLNEMFKCDYHFSPIPITLQQKEEDGKDAIKKSRIFTGNSIKLVDVSIYL